MGSLKKQIKKAWVLGLTALMVSSPALGCAHKEGAYSRETEQTLQETEASVTDKTGADTIEKTEKGADIPKGEPVVIRYGTHWVDSLDPEHVKEDTGEYTMPEAERQASLVALQAIKDELNVEFEFVQFEKDTRVELLDSVLKGEPVCDIACIWGGAEGTVLSQNVLQELDNYADLFADDETSWMFYDKIYGHNYLLSYTVRYLPRWSLIYNISMIERVDTLKDENGRTIYPTDLWKKGEWTWSAYRDYLSKIRAYYKDRIPPEEGNIYSTVQAYETDHRFAGLSALYSNGAAIYGSQGLEVDTPEAKDAMAYIRNLMKDGSMKDCGLSGDRYTPQWCRGEEDFERGGCVFTDCPDWLMRSAGSALANRNEAMGIIPWPRADRLENGSDAYSNVITLGDSAGVLKGVDPEKTELALKAFRLYWTTYYKTLGGVEKVSDYTGAMATARSASFGFDIYHPDYGEDVLDAFMYISKSLGPDYADLMNLREPWDKIFGKSLYGIDGFPEDYGEAVEENITDFTDRIDYMEGLLRSDEVHDIRPPELMEAEPDQEEKKTDNEE